MQLFFLRLDTCYLAKNNIFIDNWKLFYIIINHKIHVVKSKWVNLIYEENVMFHYLPNINNVFN